MVPRYCQKRPKGQCEEFDQRNILYHLPGDPLFEKLAKDVALSFLAHEFVPAINHAERRVEELFQIPEIEGIPDKVPQHCRPEMKEPLIDGFLQCIAIQ